MSFDTKKSLFQGASSPVLRARSILYQYGIRLPQEIDVEAIASLRGAFVREEVLDGCDGRLIKKGSYGIISVRRSTLETGRKRFTIGHELGHFELHDGSSDLIICFEKDVDQWASQGSNSELEANLFAVELLMPQEMFKPRCEKSSPSLEVIQDLAADFRTSLTATAFRYVTFSPFRCAIVISRNDKIESVKWTEDFGYVIERKRKLDSDSIAADFFAGKALPTSSFSVPAGAWIDSEKIGPAAKLREESRGFKNYGFVLTLLWLDNEFEKDEDGVDDESIDF